MAYDPEIDVSKKSLAIGCAIMFGGITLMFVLDHFGWIPWEWTPW